MDNKDVEKEKKVNATNDKVEVKKDEKEVKNKTESKEEKTANHTEGHTTKKSSKYKKLIERYKKRNRIIEVIIACVIFVIIFVLACNKTFFKTNYVKEINNSVIDLDLPMFTYFVDSDDEKIIFKTLRKSSNTRTYFDEFLTSSEFDLYYCGDNEAYYYNSDGKYFIYDIEVEKKLVVKTITINYSTADVNSFCDTVEDRD